jgi:hypothetical protein
VSKRWTGASYVTKHTLEQGQTAGATPTSHGRGAGLADCLCRVLLLPTVRAYSHLRHAQRDRRQGALGSGCVQTMSSASYCINHVLKGAKRLNSSHHTNYILERVKQPNDSYHIHQMFKRYQAPATIRTRYSNGPNSNDYMHQFKQGQNQILCQECAPTTLVLVPCSGSSIR